LLRFCLLKADMKILVSWSSGKDSAWSLHLLQKNPEFEVVGLLTTFNKSADRVAMHAVRRKIVETQARAAGVPLYPILLPWPCSNAEYEGIMCTFCEQAAADGVEGIAFGDLFLADIRAYREKQLQATGLQPVFPVWGLPTGDLARQMIAAGLRAKITCVDTHQLAAEFAGREFDEHLLADLPGSVDPCGERGEFHTVVYAGPMFRQPLRLTPGEIVRREQFVFADVIPAEKSAADQASARIKETTVSCDDP
jgi:uncharacterized protein (TIGR00290 family)